MFYFMLLGPIGQLEWAGAFETFAAQTLAAGGRGLYAPLYHKSPGRFAAFKILVYGFAAHVRNPRPKRRFQFGGA
jgi:hypothetical protein